LTHSHLIKFFYFLIKKKISEKKKRKKKTVVARPPHRAKGVAKATPNGGLAVVSATLLGPWGRPSHPLVPKGVAETTPSGYCDVDRFGGYWV
jgi:hypothetical protein